MISWWDNDTDGRSTHIYLLVKPAKGFTQRLTQHAGIHTQILYQQAVRKSEGCWQLW